jgi:Ca-activated chloride channel homolog
MPRSILVSTLFASALALTAADGPVARRAPALSPKPNLRVDVNMTLVPVTVLDQRGHNVTGLGPENFRVYDGNAARPIVSFGMQDAPVAVGIVFDCSRSMRDKFRTARKATAELFRQLNPEDEALLITVAGRAELKQGLTPQFEEIQNALLFTQPDGTTSLVDGIVLGLSELKKSQKPRKALIVISDGGENNSRYSINELVARAAEADVQLFPLCIYGNPQSDEEAAGPDLLNRLSRATGGFGYLVQDASLLHTALGRIGISLHNQYVIGYYPPDDAQGGKYRKIKVQLQVPAGLPRLAIYARSGYYVPGR